MIDLICPCSNIRKNAHIQESTFSVYRVEFDPDVVVSCQNSLKCQNCEVLGKWDPIY